MFRHGRASARDLASSVKGLRRGDPDGRVV
jgi:hypothetical protein